jgi:hypothetical protein
MSHGFFSTSIILSLVGFYPTLFFGFFLGCLCFALHFHYSLLWVVTLAMSLYNTNGFGTETMYDYYIAMKSMFLVVKLFFHLSIVYVSSFSYHELNTNNTKIISNQKPFKNQNFNSNKLCIHTITLHKWRCFSRSQTPTYISTKRKLVKKLPKVYPSHGSPCDSTINHKET